MSARWVSFPRRVNEQPISAALSVERTIVIFGRVRYGFIYDAQVGKSEGLQSALPVVATKA